MSAAAIVELFVTVIVHVIVCPSTAVVGVAVFWTLRSPSGGSGAGGGGSGGGGGGGGGGPGGIGGAVDLRVFVKVQTTVSPFATAPSTFVPGTDTSGAPFRVHETAES